ncbi:MAG TPA: ribonuclease H-like domain-containing protein [Blastocatellia bacterium]|nr:ribonuclease H-like domain-containing protein [Blastocatellia bacterium]
MLKNTFCHMPGVSLSRERRLWDAGIRSWDALRQARLPRGLAGSLPSHIQDSLNSLESGSPDYFAERLQTNQHWRLFPDFRASIAYLDIETTGLGYGACITTIAVYDGKSIYHYVKNVNLSDFAKDIKRYSLIVTYNGKCFDVPFIENQFGIKMRQAHIDLRYVLKSLGYTGGLKGCEKSFGIDRDQLAGVDGYFAVLLWNDFVKNKNPRALETLLAYNVQDVVNLETLLVLAYNLKLKETPFHDTLRLSLPPPPPLPFQADPKTINRIRMENQWQSGGFARWH